MDVTQLQMQLCNHQNAMIEQGLVNREFLELVSDLDSTMILAKNIDKSLECLNFVSEALENIPADFESVDFYACLNGRLTTRLCVAKAKNIWLLLKNYSKAHDLERCVGCLQQLRDEYSLVRDNLERLITLQREIAASGVSISMGGLRFFTMDVTQLQMQLCDHQNAMIEQGLVNPEFLELVRDLDSTMILAKNIDKSLECLNFVSEALENIPADFESVDFYACLNGRLTTRLCVAKAKNIWLLLKNYSKAHDLERCVGCLQQLRDEYSLVRDNLERLITLQREIAASGVSIPTLE